ncbi:histidine phosphatase superfamily [Jimgerdemannia flammicorona]|uniref:Histidine phosphatase superfamily n=2 Tax=Jimgerdemannia flammicorona TaxID=994334 RepID=A0A433QD91_9FUNG|nr:histidine phosphatase superfamily [Jimgerdemannia flammicorona]RUS27709.1 histidine phosphatase superfamily [Jimgerdemannia flammicorona]
MPSPNKVITLPPSLRNQYVLFRHGRSLANERGVVVSAPENGVAIAGGPLGTGWGLSEVGKAQVMQSAQTLADFLYPYNSTSPLPEVRIYTSPFLRASETASIIHTVLTNTSLTPAPPISYPIVHPSLSERFFGDFELHSDKIYNTVWAADADDGAHTRWNVESCVSVRNRTASLVLDVIEPLPPAPAFTAVLVAHGDALQILQTAFEDVPVSTHRQLRHVETAEWKVARGTARGRISADR